MEGECLLLLISFGFCLTEWVLLPSLSTERNDNEKIYSIRANVSTLSEERCPDFHNLTTMTYGTVFTEPIQSRGDWEISYDDVEQLIKENEQLPKTTGDMVEYVTVMGNNLMAEAEKRIKGVFLPSREARTKHIDHPSMESALLTIAMLLFGVYLSKLILKLLLSHYNRFNGGVMMGIRTPIAMPMGRRKRSIQLQNINIMYLIDNYNARFNQGN